jgi:type IV pilus assembly protein PilV
MILRPQSGFSLIELLVALIVFTIGLLAIAGLQTVSKQANYESLQRTTAAQVANGMLEDIRTNGGGIDTYLAVGDLGGGSRGAEPAPNCTSGSECNAAEKATFDLWVWEQMIDGNLEMNAGTAAGGLLLPTLCIGGPLVGGAGTYQVTIVWRGSASITNVNASLCGLVSGNYGAQNVLRRVVEITTFIDPTF